MVGVFKICFQDLIQNSERHIKSICLVTVFEILSWKSCPKNIGVFSINFLFCKWHCGKLVLLVKVHKTQACLVDYITQSLLPFAPTIFNLFLKKILASVQNLHFSFYTPLIIKYCVYNFFYFKLWLLKKKKKK